MPNLSQITNQCDSLIDNVYNKLTAKQGNYLANRLHYWQGLCTHSIIPHHTTSKWDNQPPDLLSTHPTDQYEDWISTIPDFSATPIPCAFVANIYDGPSGKGYELVALFFFNNVRYERHINVGPETYRDSAWASQEA